MNNSTGKNFDRTMVAVKRQLKAMNAPLYEVGLYHREADKMLPRLWTAEEVIKSIAWLKAMNFKGHDIFIRPEGSQGLVFFDDLSRGTIEKMKADGYSPAVIIESSPMNFHGWIRVSDKPIPEVIATGICKTIAAHYCGDTDSADWRHYGRLAGFTNRKPKHIQDNGRHPFVLLSEANGKPCAKAAELVSYALEKLEERRALQAQRRALATSRARSGGLRDACDYYKSQLAGLMARYGGAMDCSRADWMIVTKMITLGYSEDAIKQAMEAHSPALDSRQGHMEKYIAVTLANALGKEQ